MRAKMPTWVRCLRTFYVEMFNPSSRVNLSLKYNQPQPSPFCDKRKFCDDLKLH